MLRERRPSSSKQQEQAARADMRRAALTPRFVTEQQLRHLSGPLQVLTHADDSCDVEKVTHRRASARDDPVALHSELQRDGRSSHSRRLSQ